MNGAVTTDRVPEIGEGVHEIALLDAVGEGGGGGDAEGDFSTRDRNGSGGWERDLPTDVNQGRDIEVGDDIVIASAIE